MTNEEFLESIKPELKSIREDAYDEGYKTANKDKQFDPYLQPNINFSLTLREDDERNEKYKKQRLERGFDDTELWNLDSTILKFVLPRLKAFKECTIGYPAGFETQEDWLNTIQKMIDSIEHINDEGCDETVEDYEGFDLFKKYFFNLWW